MQCEVTYLGRLRHPNLVKLIGFCLDGEDRILVYEFMPGGSLEKHLFKSENLIRLLYIWSLQLIKVYYILTYCTMYMTNYDMHVWIIMFAGNAPSLSWARRIKVAVGAARGLCFLHESKSPVIYRDFKTSNILLDSVSKIIY